ncbi:enoyl-CoA hydratase/isomerase family protein [Echinicola marina]|uniref:enoyl-CoA hydratase/isomerase family protein n=1 Tax=Echinicola marina TaxID=2859768 RepID=UPI001CF61D51|nr:enoyl-CoA hydratase-related protein [Echinicola marina]UCS93759.1 enoyl-CoA hydratase/isomerase family protein [Echinicola marina]
MGNHVVIEKQGRIAYVIMNRPEKRNALNGEMVGRLIAAFDALEKDAEVRVVILKGEGKVFCAGADLEDIKNMQLNNFEENLADSRHLKELFYKIYTFPKVVIAQVHGHAIAGGCGLVSVCDFSFVVPAAFMGYTEVRIGFVPAMVLVFLLRKIGEGAAKSLLLGGELVSGEKAKALGLVNEVYDAGELEEKVRGFAEGLLKQNSGQSLALTKEMIAKVQEMGLEDALDYAAHMNAQARGTEDCKKGIAAFLEKKTIEW